MPRTKVYNDKNVIRLTTAGATKKWVKQNVIAKGGKVDPVTYRWVMPNGDNVIAYAVGIRIIPKNEVPKTKVFKGYAKEDDMPVKTTGAKGLKIRIVRKPTNGSKTVNLRIR